MDWGLNLVLLFFPACDLKTYNYVYYDEFIKAYHGKNTQQNCFLSSFQVKSH